MRSGGLRGGEWVDRAVGSGWAEGSGRKENARWGWRVGWASGKPGGKRVEGELRGGTALWGKQPKGMHGRQWPEASAWMKPRGGERDEGHARTAGGLRKRRQKGGRGEGVARMGTVLATCGNGRKDQPEGIRARNGRKGSAPSNRRKGTAEGNVQRGTWAKGGERSEEQLGEAAGVESAGGSVAKPRMRSLREGAWRSCG